MKRVTVIIIALVGAIGATAEVAMAQAPPVSALLRLESDPAAVFLKLGNVDSILVTQTDTTLAPGRYRVETTRFGYQPLAHEFRLDAGDTLTLRFVLLAQRPVRPSPEDLGMSYEIVMPLVPEEQSRSVRKKYNTMAEVFAIIPLTQGVMAAVALGGGSDYFSAELMVGGACLSAGSYLLGRLMSSRKLKEIRGQNEILTARNVEAETHNEEVDILLRRSHAEALREWQAEAGQRGHVEINRRP
jgi:hypothetical protein